MSDLILAVIVALAILCAYRAGVNQERERQARQRKQEEAKRRAEERIKHYVSPVVQATRWQRQVRPLIERDIEAVVREANRQLEE